MKEEEEVAESSESPVLQDQQHRPFTIVYDGKICVHDATEIQVLNYMCVCLYIYAFQFIFYFFTQLGNLSSSFLTYKLNLVPQCIIK
jgi:hypothetical protein